MTTEGIEAVFLTTHNWGKAAKFFQELGYKLEFDTGHSSGQLRNGDGPYVFIAEVPEDQPPATRIVLRVPGRPAVESPGPGQGMSLVADDQAVAPDSTAVRVALWRAMHVQGDPAPHVLPPPGSTHPGPPWWPRSASACI